MEYNRNEGAGKKIVEGILASCAIMLLFMMLQVFVSLVGTTAALTAHMLSAGGDADQALNALWDTTSGGRFMTLLTLVATLVSTLFSLPAYWIVWGRKRTEQDRRYFREKVLRIKPFAMIVIACCGLYYVAILISAVIAVVSPDTMEAYNEMMDMALGGSEILAMMAAVLLAPINEECIMRGLILRNLQRHFSMPAAIVIQAVLFGIFHANWVQGIYVLPVGAALGYVAVKSRSVIPCVFMHLFYNMLTFVAAMLPEFCQTWAFAIGVVVASALAVWYMGRAERGTQSAG
ncbi:MAG: CPBP family intramembrane metalloprotease [Lachnospiraceae bacterium]|nr:CPBP family intramembrane metalloprotease [Lachnospiraceae bacterium]